MRKEAPKATKKPAETSEKKDIELTERELNKVSGGFIEPTKIEFPNLTLVTKDAARA
jgi:bacteriocin-like protein